MTQAQPLGILGWLWAAFGVYWVVAARGGKAAQSTEPQLYRFFRLAILFVTFALLFSERTRIGPLGRRFLPQNRAIEGIGFLLALSGMAIAVWARIHLGQYWSDKVVLKVDHQLIRTGPYAYMRHPIYSGVLLAVAGTAQVVGEWRGLLALVILVVNYSIKARREEQILAGAFADTFADHKRRAGFLLPRLRPRS
jgi:protein-S-isoprenylcysteine O-methyltransferase Ste14